jgi:4-amino-4-deoxy-L-arabinose transferase-like glycosyltransferase
MQRSQIRPKLRPDLWTWAAIFLLLIFWISRTHNLLILPIFLDEASHITRAQWVWEGKPLYLLETGKALAPYMAALFWPFAGAPFIGRYVVVMLGAIGLASAYAVGRELHSRQAGVLCMVLWLICPQLLFFERMALVDTTISSMAMLTLWIAIRMMRSGQFRAAILCGVGLALCAFAKTTGIVFFPIPVLVAVLVRARTGWLIRARQIVIAYVIAALILVGPLLYALSVGADPTGQKYGLTTTATTASNGRPFELLLNRMQANGQDAWQAEQIYFSRGMMLVILFSLAFGVGYATRTTLLLAALVIGLIGAVLVTAASLWLRYLSAAAPFILMLTSISLLTLTSEIQKLRRVQELRFLPPLVSLVPWIVTGVWAVLVGIPFHSAAYNDPPQLTLPERDTVEYIQWIPSGYGIREAAAYIHTLEDKPFTVVGTAVNCNGARLYMPLGTLARYVCPDLDWAGGNYLVVKQIETLARENGYVYVLGEDIAIVREDQLPKPYELLKTFRRPGGGYTVKLYRVEASGTAWKP